MDTTTLPAHLAYLPVFFRPAIAAAAADARRQDPSLDDGLATVRVLRDLLTWLQGDRKLDWPGELLTQGRGVRGPSETPDATWGQLAHAMRLATGQSAYSYLTPTRDARLARMSASTRERMRPVTTKDLPGVGVVEAARRLGVTTATVYARVKRGELGHEYVGETLRITEDLKLPDGQ